MKIEEIPGSASVDAWFDTEQAAIVMSERVGDHYDFDQILRWKQSIAIVIAGRVTSKTLRFFSSPHIFFGQV